VLKWGSFGMVQFIVPSCVVTLIGPALRYCTAGVT
jgi:hypothetical protein